MRKDFKKGDVIEFAGDRFTVLKNSGDSGKVQEFPDGAIVEPFYWEFEGEDCVLIKDANKPDRGHRYIRTTDGRSPKEKILADDWEKENLESGILQRLFISGSIQWDEKAEVKINLRDRMIAATVIQWLGSNVGFCFLETCLKKMGYKLTIQ
jgi:hypothetical protein